MKSVRYEEEDEEAVVEEAEEEAAAQPSKTTCILYIYLSVLYNNTDFARLLTMTIIDLTAPPYHPTPSRDLKPPMHSYTGTIVR